MPRQRNLLKEESVDKYYDQLKIISEKEKVKFEEIRDYFIDKDRLEKLKKLLVYGS